MELCSNGKQSELESEEQRWRIQRLSYRNLGLLALVPLITLGLVWTNNLHGLMRYNIGLDTSGPFSVVTKAYGPWFWVHTTYSYALFFMGTFELVWAFFRLRPLYRKQSGMVLASAFVLWVANILYVTGLSPIPHLDITPSAFAISGLTIAWGALSFPLIGRCTPGSGHDH